MHSSSHSRFITIFNFITNINIIIFFFIFIIIIKHQNQYHPCHRHQHDNSLDDPGRQRRSSSGGGGSSGQQQLQIGESNNTGKAHILVRCTMPQITAALGFKHSGLAVLGSQPVGLLWQRRGHQLSLLQQAACHRGNAGSCEDDRLLSGYRMPPVELICKPRQSRMQRPCCCFLIGEACRT